MAIVDYPLLLLLPISFFGMLAATALGGWLATRRETIADESREDFNVIQAATLTLLGLIIGFTFSMSLSRYDQRKNLEEEEANAIGTAYLRADLLPEADAAKVRTLLRDYTQLRMRYYTTRDAAELADVNAKTAKTQDALWAAVRGPASANPTPLTQLMVVSANDVINSQGYTQAAWWNRIPVGAWVLMFVMGLSANFLVGVGAKRPGAERKLLAVLPFIVACAFFLIGDIDAPRGGVIRVHPQNLQVLVDSLK